MVLKTWLRAVSAVAVVLEYPGQEPRGEKLLPSKMVRREQKE
jgi:hypothetical protein